MTSFLFRAHPVSMVYAGPIFWDQSHAREIMRWYRDFLPKAPPELCALPRPEDRAVRPRPSRRRSGARRICALISCYAGTQADGEAAMQPVRDRAAGAAARLDEPDAVPGAAEPVRRLLPKGLQWYWKGDFVQELTDAAIEAHLRARRQDAERAVAHAPLPDRQGGARGRPGDTAWGCRDATWSMVIAAHRPRPRQGRRAKNWAKTTGRACTRTISAAAT